MPTRRSLYPPITKSQADKAASTIRKYLRGDHPAPSSPDDLLPLAVTLARWRSMHAYSLSLVTPGVRNWVGQESRGPVVVAQRLKRLDRILWKLRRFPTMRLSQMEDVAGCRAVLPTPAEVDAVAKRIMRKWDVQHPVADYREAGKETGYRALHIVVLRQERLVEIQLRTAGQHYWAEQVERIASLAGYPGLKDGDGPADLLEYFHVASELTYQREHDLPLSKELQDRLANLREQVRPYYRAHRSDER